MCKACLNSDKLQTKTTFTVEYDDSVIVIRNVPCLECEICGEITFEDEVAAKLERLVEKAKTVLQDVSIIDYGKVA